MMVIIKGIPNFNNLAASDATASDATYEASIPVKEIIKEVSKEVKLEVKQVSKEVNKTASSGGGDDWMANLGWGATTGGFASTADQNGQENQVPMQTQAPNTLTPIYSVYH